MIWSSSPTLPEVFAKLLPHGLLAWKRACGGQSTVEIHQALLFHDTDTHFFTLHDLKQQLVPFFDIEGFTDSSRNGDLPLCRNPCSCHNTLLLRARGNSLFLLELVNHLGQDFLAGHGMPRP